MNLIDAKNDLADYLDNDIPAFLMGEAGIGKSALVHEMARERRWNIVDIRVILLDPVDLRGLPYVKEGIAYWSNPSFLPHAKRDGEEGILFLDELNAAPVSVTNACLQLVLDRKLGEYALPSGWRIVAAGNPQGARSGAQRMSDALRNRFARINVHADPESWIAWAGREGLSPILRAFIKYVPKNLHNLAEDNNMSPRSWARTNPFLDRPDASRQRLISGIVGEGGSVELEGFIKAWRTLPPLEECIRNPKHAPIPTEASTLYMIATGLARKAERGNFENIIIYAGRLSREFEVALIKEAVEREKSLKETSAFTRWASKNPSAMG